MTRRIRVADLVATLPTYLLALMIISGLSMAALSASIALRGSGFDLWRLFHGPERPRPAAAAPTPSRPPSFLSVPSSHKDIQIFTEIGQHFVKLYSKVDGAEFDIRQIRRAQDSKPDIDWIAVATAVVGLLQGLVGLGVMIVKWWRRKAAQPELVRPWG